METFTCNKTEIFCTKPNGTLHIQFDPRDNKSPSDSLLNLILYTKNETLPGKADDETGKKTKKLIRILFCKDLIVFQDDFSTLVPKTL